MYELIAEIRWVFGALRRWEGKAVGGRDLSGGMRAVMLLLLDGEEETVSGLARARGVSRQQVQQQVDRLLELGFVERLDNPAHRRAPLIALTSKGRAVIKSIRAAELDALSRLQLGVSDEAIDDAVRVLEALRNALERDLKARKAARL